MAARQLPPGRGAAPADPRGRAAQLLTRACRSCATPPLAGLPRVYGIAWAYVAHTDSVLNEELFTAFLNAYQDIDELTLGELWALPTTLRVVLLENLRRVAERIAETRWRARSRMRHGTPPTRSPRTTSTCCTARCKAAACRRAISPSSGSSCRSSTAKRDRRSLKWTEQHCPNGPALVSEAQTRQAAANLTRRQHHHHAAHDRPGRVGRPDRAGQPLAARAARTAQLQRAKASSRASRSPTRWNRWRAPAAGRSAKSRRPWCAWRCDAAGDSPEDEDAETRWSHAERTAGYYLFGQGRPALMRRAGAGATARRRAHRAAPSAATRLAPAALPAGRAGRHRAAAGRCGARPEPRRLARRRRGWRRSRCVLMVFPAVRSGDRAGHPARSAESARVQPLPRLDFAARHSRRRTACWSSFRRC